MVVYHRRLPKFEYLVPKSMARAFFLLGLYKGNAKVIAGGTDLIPKLKRRETKTPEYIIDLKGIRGLDYIEYDIKDGLRIGPLATIHAIESSQVIKDKFSVLYEAAQSMASIQVRNRATLAGNICNAVPSADTAPALMTLDARLVLLSSDGERRVNIGEFFTGPNTTILATDEILGEIRIPTPSAQSRGKYIKLSPRSAMDLAVAGVAVMVTSDCGTCNDIKIALGAVAPTPMRAVKAENYIKGRSLTPEAIEKTAEIAGTECRPITDHRASKEYRCEMVKVLTKRAITQAIGDL